MIQAQLTKSATPNMMATPITSLVPIVRFLYTTRPSRFPLHHCETNARNLVSEHRSTRAHSLRVVELYGDFSDHLDRFALRFEGRELPLLHGFRGRLRQNWIALNDADVFNRSIFSDVNVETNGAS